MKSDKVPSEKARIMNHINRIREKVMCTEPKLTPAQPSPLKYER